MKTIIGEFVDLFKREPLILFLLSWFLLAGSTLSTYAVLILVPYVLTHEDMSKEIDGLFLLILLYSGTAALYTYLNGYYEGVLGNLFFESLYPPLFYILGKWLIKTNEIDSIYWIFLIIIGFIAIPVFIEVINDIKTNQFINTSRLIERSDGSTASSATNLGIRVSLAVASAGVIVGKCNSSKERFFTIVFLLLSILGITCVFHLVNRTGIIVICVSIIVIFLLNIKALSKINIVIGGFSLIILSVLYIPKMHFFSEVDNAYQQRIDNGDNSVTTAGGRTDLWMMGVENLYKKPFGLAKSERLHYSHNYWLDTNMRGGLFAFIFLLIITIKHVLNSVYVIREFRPSLLRTLVITCNVGFFLTGAVEPIMEGFMAYVFLLFFFMGMVSEFRNFC